MNDIKRHPPRFVPTLTDVVQAPKAVAPLVVAPDQPLPLADSAPDMADRVNRLEARLLPAAHSALQAEIERFSQLAHARLEEQLRQVIQQALQED
jgi:hypothetical protein